MCLSCRSRKMLQNEYLVAKFGFDTAKNESRQVLHFLAEKLKLNTVLQDRIRQLRFFSRQDVVGWRGGGGGRGRGGGGRG